MSEDQKKPSKTEAGPDQRSTGDSELKVESFDLETLMAADLDQLGLSEEERFKIMMAAGGGGSKVGSIIVVPACTCGGPMTCIGGGSISGGSCT